jgi:hypothetical protein
VVNRWSATVCNSQSVCAGEVPTTWMVLVERESLIKNPSNRANDQKLKKIKKPMHLDYRELVSLIDNPSNRTNDQKLKRKKKPMHLDYL